MKKVDVGSQKRLQENIKAETVVYYYRYAYDLETIKKVKVSFFPLDGVDTLRTEECVCMIIKELTTPPYKISYGGIGKER